MKSFIILTAALLISFSVKAQEGPYLGYENGLKFDFYNYIDNQANTLKMLPFNKALGAYVGYKISDYTIETGFYGYFSTYPNVKLDPVSGIPSKVISIRGSAMSKWVIPVRFGKEFTFCSEKLYLKPELGFVTMIARTYGPDNYLGKSGNDASLWYSSPKTDRLEMTHYSTGKYNFGMETSVCAGGKIKNSFDIYVKGTYTAAFATLNYSTITYTSPNKTVTATASTQNSMIYQVGIRYYFKQLMLRS